MHYNQDTRTIPLNPTSVASNATATLIVDTRGYANAQFIVLPATAAATTRVLTLKVGESDNTSTFTDVSGYVGGTNAANGFTLPAEMATAPTAVQPLVLNVDLIGKKRYLQLSYTPGTTVVVGAICNLSRPATSPDAISEAISAQGTNGAHGAGNTTVGVVVNGPFTQLGA
jgi:hypothetical protein